MSQTHKILNMHLDSSLQKIYSLITGIIEDNIFIVMIIKHA